MFGLKYFKADSSTFVIKTVKGEVKQQGKGLSFFYHSAASSIATLPVNVQESPFIFNLKTADFQALTVQGQLAYQIESPLKMSEMLNFTLKKDGVNYATEDPLKLSDRVIRVVQAMIQNKIQASTLREALSSAPALVALVQEQLKKETSLEIMGIVPLDISISAIQPSTETSRALEAEAREEILKEADDATYLRRKSAVEQERMIKEAELQTDLSVQQKEQEIEELRIANERTLLRAEMETEQERLQAKIEAENQRKALVSTQVENSKQEADAKAYAIAAKMKAFKELPVDNLKAMALANMQPEQLMAMAFESLAQNADKIGELNISPDLFSQMAKKVGRKR